MTLNDRQIREYGEMMISPFSGDAVGTISYDLTTRAFAVSKGENRKKYVLAPGETIFVIPEEVIQLPDNMICRVVLRNSRIRQGLSLTAPVYFPGHKTRPYFRITNVTGSTISLDTEKGIAALIFEEMENKPDNPYNGSFQDELEFEGLGAYEQILSDDVASIENKIDNVKEIERHIYGNVLAIMAIFIGIFSVININMQHTEIDLKSLIVIDLTTVGAISALVALINSFLPSNIKKAIPIVISIISFAIAILLLFIQI